MSTNAPRLFSKHRLEALTDGIFAVAMTLLVIELKVPEHGAVQVAADVPHAVAQQMPTFIAWTISFLVLAIFWSAQQRLFHVMKKVDDTFTWLTLWYLAMVSLMPFSSALVGQYGSVLFSQMFNSAHMALLSLTSLLMTRYVSRHPEIQDGALPPRFYKAAGIRALGLLMVALLAVGISAVLPGLGSTAFILMFPITRMSRRLEREQAIACSDGA
jgi:uncharacterized membrane protein